MRIGILNGDLGIAVIDSIEDVGAIQLEKIKKELQGNAGLNDLVFFYMPDRDWIVINKSHDLYEYYLEIISYYLGLSVEGRKKSIVYAPTDTVKKAFRILDGIIIRRALIYGKVGLGE